MRRRALPFALASLATLAIARDNSQAFSDEGDSTSGWSTSNAALAVTGSWLRHTKTSAGTSSSMTKTIGSFTPSNADYILYGSARTSSGASHIGVIWFLNGSKEMSIWFGSSAANTTYTSGAISICGTTGAATRNVKSVATGVDYTNQTVQFALHFDFKFSRLNCYIKQFDGSWAFGGYAACDWFSSTSMQVLTTSSTPAGGWCEIDYLTLVQPQYAVIGDSIAAGSTLFSPASGSALNDGTSTWMNYVRMPGNQRNSLIVNKGVGSQASTTIAARMADVTGAGAKIVFLHASSNDAAGSISQATRTTNIQSSIDAVLAAGGRVILLNALHGTIDSADNTGGTPLMAYSRDWWINYRQKISGSMLDVDISKVMSSYGTPFQRADISQGDKLHPTPAGYKLIGRMIEQALRGRM